MRVLITGGAGFIGSNYVYAHLKAHPTDEITVLDALTYSGHRENLAAAEEQGVHFVQGRIEDRRLIQELFESKQFEQVVHFAAETHVDRSIADPGLFLQTNVMGTQVLLDAARDYSVKRFHHISTDEVYGDLGFDSTEKFTEESPLQPSSPYSASKASSDLLCLAYLRTFGVPVTLSRCSNNYGPYQSLENLIPLLIQKALREEALPLYGTGENVRDWLFVKDHCSAILAILERGKVGEVYNVGGNCEKNNLTVARTILNALGKPESLIQFVEDRKGHDERYAIDFTKLKNTLGWSPSTSFEEGMQETLNWYKLKHSLTQSHERSHSGRRNGITTRTSNQSHQQAPAAGL